MFEDLDRLGCDAVSLGERSLRLGRKWLLRLEGQAVQQNFFRFKIDYDRYLVNVEIL
jgi:hypothetical protein